MTSTRDEFDAPAGFWLLATLRRWRVPGRVLAAIGAALLLVIVAVIVISYPRHRGAPAGGAVPLIQADAVPYRVKPQDPGGMTIPYRDSTVFDALHGKQAPPAAEEPGKVENLLGLPEQPMPRDKIFPAQPQAPAAPLTASATVNPVAPPPAPAAEAQPPPMPAAAVEATPIPVEAAPVKPVAAEKIAAAKPAAAKVSPNGDAYVQLGAVQSAEEAKAVWTKAKAANAGALGGLDLRVGKVTLPKGTFYRVQGGPLSEAKAKSICASLNAKKAGSCLVAHR